MSYTADDIQSLSFAEGVRTRIQMYLGSDDIEGTYQGLKEIINNSTDEAIAGFGTKIVIEVNEQENSVSVRDYGRGCPFRINPDGTNVLVDIYTKAHTGGKFREGAYKNSSGLNGIGGSCVCLSSEAFIVRSYRDQVCAEARLERGKLISYKETPTQEPNGTYVWFKPDATVFKNGKIGFTFERICAEIKDIVFLYKGLTFVVTNLNTKETHEYVAKNGIVDFVKESVIEPMHNHIIYVTETDGTDTIELAMQWGVKHETPFTFVNGLRCPEHGVNLTGARSSLTRTFNSLSGKSFEADIIRQNLFYVMNFKITEPSFANQVKSKINSPSARALASKAMSDALKEMAANYPSEFETIVTYLDKIRRADAAAERARKQVLETVKEIGDEKKKRLILADKLKDCKQHGPDSGSVLAVCEGDSALGALVQARPIDSVALMPIRGKIISALKHDQEKILANEEVKAIFSALGCGFLNNYNPKKLRYQYVGIASDGDVDGDSIANLITTLFFYMCPQFIQEGRLFRMKMPLFVLKYKNKTLYAFSSEERDALIAEHGKPNEIGRKKGIGENSPEETRVAVFGDQRRWERININDYPKYCAMMEQLMGKSVDDRRDFIMENVNFSNITE